MDVTATGPDPQADFDAATMPLTATVARYLEMQGWDDEIEVAAEQRHSTLATGIHSDGQNYRLYIEADEVRRELAVYLYSPFSIGANRMGEAARLLNLINARLRMGRLSCPDDGASHAVQFCVMFNFMNSLCSPQQIEVMVDAGMWTLRHYGQALAAVAFADLGARESWAAHQRRQQSEPADDDSSGATLQ